MDRRRSGILILLLIVSILIGKEHAISSYPVVAKLISISGDVIVKRLGIEKTINLHAGDLLFIGDLIETEKDARAQIVFPDGMFINLGDLSRLMINQYIYEKSTDRRMGVLRLVKGKSRVVISEKGGRGSSFTVLTDTARIAADTGDFIVNSSDDETLVFSIEGQLLITNINGLVVGSVELRPNHETVVKKDSPPLRPYIIGRAEKKEMIKSTDISL